MCSLEELPEMMDDRDEWQERARENVLAAQHNDDGIYIYTYI